MTDTNDAPQPASAACRPQDQTLPRNGDLHAKNLSVYAPNGNTWVVTPAYDIASTYLYDDHRMALSIGQHDQPTDITRSEMLRLANETSVSDRTAARLIDEQLAASDHRGTRSQAPSTDPALFEPPNNWKTNLIPLWSRCDRPSATDRRRKRQTYPVPSHRCYIGAFMARVITQRQLRNESGEIMRALDQGQSFIVTRNGVPVAQLSPIKAREFVSRELVATIFERAPELKPERFRRDVDRLLDQTPTPRA
ncbi:MAG: type II toxin-antitoxin system prevent-host-death family antitoxin [Acidimicrobiia bacterium]